MLTNGEWTVCVFCLKSKNAGDQSSMGVPLANRILIAQKFLKHLKDTNVIIAIDYLSNMVGYISRWIDFNSAVVGGLSSARLKIIWHGKSASVNHKNTNLIQPTPTQQFKPFSCQLNLFLPCLTPSAIRKGHRDFDGNNKCTGITVLIILKGIDRSNEWHTHDTHTHNKTNENISSSLIWH